MLSQTTIMAIRALVYLGLFGKRDPVSPKAIAEALECSPTYLVKTLGMLTKAGLLRAVRGSHGGVMLAQPAEAVTLLQVVEACQGMLYGSYCEMVESLEATCSFHKAMQEVHEATVRALERWTIADLVAKPLPDGEVLDPCRCRMAMPCLLKTKDEETIS